MLLFLVLGVFSLIIISKTRRRLVFVPTFANNCDFVFGLRVESFASFFCLTRQWRGSGGND